MKIFVYGTLRKGWGNHQLIKDAKGKYLYSTLVPVKSVVNVGFPKADFNGSNYMLFGEVYEIDGKNIGRIDSLEGHPDWYIRTPVTDIYGMTIEAYHMEGVSNNLDGFILFDLPGLPKCIAWSDIEPERIRGFKSQYKSELFLVPSDYNTNHLRLNTNITCNIGTREYTGDIVLTQGYIRSINKLDNCGREILSQDGEVVGEKPAYIHYSWYLNNND